MFSNPSLRAYVTIFLCVFVRSLVKSSYSKIPEKFPIIVSTNQNIVRALPGSPDVLTSASRHSISPCCLATSFAICAGAALGARHSMVLFCGRFNLSFVHVIVWFVLHFA